jgi:hypothetical protein
VAAAETYEKYAEMIDQHWDRIVAYCKPGNKVALSFIEGLNNKIRAIQLSAYACATRSTADGKSSPACYRHFEQEMIRVFPRNSAKSQFWR